MSKSTLRRVLGILVCANTALFIVLALLQKLSMDPKAAVFVDFWGRFCVYSLWFIGYLFYRAYIERMPVAKWITIVLVVGDIPFFLLLAYFNKISNTPDTLIFVDFWGRITVYSLWFICYELYRTYLLDGRASAV